MESLSTSKYITLRPKSEFLHDYIAYYYIDQESKHGAVKEFIYYPHYKNALTIYLNSKVEMDKYSSISKPSKKTHIETIYLGAETNARYVKIIAPYNKIGIVFQPLGINYFLSSKKKIQDLVSIEKNGSFEEFSPSLSARAQEIFKCNSDAEKVTMLDDFFLNNFNGFAEERLIESIHLLMGNINLSTNELSAHLNTNRKTVYRLFKRHLNRSFEEYKSIVKFRNVISSYQNETDRVKLTHLAYANSYYDQSDFINSIKKITGSNPKKFFSGLSNVGSEDTFWTLLNQV